MDGCGACRRSVSSVRLADLSSTGTFVLHRLLNAHISHDFVFQTADPRLCRRLHARARLRIRSSETLLSRSADRDKKTPSLLNSANTSTSSRDCRRVRSTSIRSMTFAFQTFAFSVSERERPETTKGRGTDETNEQRAGDQQRRPAKLASKQQRTAKREKVKRQRGGVEREGARGSSDETAARRAVKSLRVPLTPREGRSDAMKMGRERLCYGRRVKGCGRREKAEETDSS